GISAIAPDGKRAVVGLRGSFLRLWDLANERQIRVFRGHEAAVKAAAFSPDGKTLLSAANDGTVRLWSVENGIVLKQFRAMHRPGTAVFSPDGRNVVALAADNSVHCWNVADWYEFQQFPPSRKEIFKLACDGRSILAGGDGLITLWSIHGGEPRTWNVET